MNNRFGSKGKLLPVDHGLWTVLVIVEKTQSATPQLDDVDPVFRVGRNNAQPAKPKRAGDGCDASGGRHMAHGNNLGQIGAGEGIRTLDPDLGKVVLYP